MASTEAPAAQPLTQDTKQKLEGVFQEFNYWEPDVLQSTVVSEYDRDFLPIAALQDRSPIEFHIRGSDNQYLDLSKSVLRVDVIIARADNSAPAANTIGPVNALLHALFEKVEVRLGGVNINDPNTLYPYRAFVAELLNHTDSEATSELRSIGWCKDTVGQYNIVDCAATGANAGLLTRAAWFAGRRRVTLIGRLHVDIFNQEKCIPPLIDVNIRLYQTSEAFRLMTGTANPDHKVRIMDCVLQVRTKEVSPSLMMAHEKMVQLENFRIPIKRVHAKHFALPTQSQLHTIDNVLMGEIPELVIIGFVPSTAMAGAYAENPFYFTHQDLREIWLEANGERFPRLNWAPNFGADADTMLAYKGFLSALEQYDEDDRPAISYDEYRSGLSLFAFKLTATPLGPGLLTGGAPVVRSPTRTGSVRLHMRFGTQTPVNLNVLLLAQYKGMIEIDKFRNVVLTD
jgi:hypothetical protein